MRRSLFSILLKISIYLANFEIKKFADLIDSEDDIREIFDIKSIKSSETEILLRIIELSRDIFRVWSGSQLTAVKHYVDGECKGVYGYVLRPPTDGPGNYIFDYISSCLKRVEGEERSN